jgi:mercuric ion transport protein
MKMAGQKKVSIGLVGAIVSALVTSTALLAVTCCAGPIVFLSLGFGMASLSNLESLAPYRWILLSITVLFLATAFVRVYLRSDTESCESSCSTVGNARNKKILFWIVVVVVIALISFPFLFEKFLLQVK